jgi:hypothetical protein
VGDVVVVVALSSSSSSSSSFSLRCSRMQASPRRASGGASLYNRSGSERHSISSADGDGMFAGSPGEEAKGAGARQHRFMTSSGVREPGRPATPPKRESVEAPTVPSRYGVLTKRGSKMKTWRERYFELVCASHPAAVTATLCAAGRVFWCELCGWCCERVRRRRVMQALLFLLLVLRGVGGRRSAATCSATACCVLCSAAAGGGGACRFAALATAAALSARCNWCWYRRSLQLAANVAVAGASPLLVRCRCGW